MNPDTEEITQFDSQSFETLKCILWNESNGILLDVKSKVISNMGEYLYTLITLIISKLDLAYLLIVDMRNQLH